MAFTLSRSTATRVLLFISGALSVVLAIVSFRHFGETYAVLLLSLWIGISLIFQGISGVGAGNGEGDRLGRGWYICAGTSPSSPASWCWHGHLTPSPCSPKPASQPTPRANRSTRHHVGWPPP